MKIENELVDYLFRCRVSNNYLHSFLRRNSSLRNIWKTQIFKFFQYSYFEHFCQSLIVVVWKKMKRKKHASRLPCWQNLKISISVFYNYKWLFLIKKMHQNILRSLYYENIPFGRRIYQSEFRFLRIHKSSTR